MREVISVHIGQTAVDLGNVTWELFDMSHYIHSDYQNTFGIKFPLPQIDSFYKEIANNDYVPRALYIDTSQDHFNTIKNNDVAKRLSSNDQLMIYESPFDQNFRSTNESMHCMRKKLNHLVNECDALDGFLLYTAVNEDTADITRSVIEVIKEEYSTKSLFSFNLLPLLTHADNDERGNGNNIINSILSLSEEATQCDLNMLFDTRAIDDICRNILDFNMPSQSYNHQIIAQVLDSFTYSLRDPSYLNIPYSMKGIVNQLVNSTRMNFAHSSYVNFIPAGEGNYLPYKMNEIGKMLCLPDYSLIHYDNNLQYKIISSILSSNGSNLSTKDYKSCFNEWKTQQANNLRPNSTIMLMKNHKKHAVIPGGDLEYLPRTACSVTNTTLSGDLLRGLVCQYEMLIKKNNNIIKAYSNKGYETSDFVNAKESLLNVIESYNECLD